jgi:hypothetical protein
MDFGSCPDCKKVFQSLRATSQHVCRRPRGRLPTRSFYEQPRASTRHESAREDFENRQHTHLNRTWDDQARSDDIKPLVDTEMPELGMLDLIGNV